MTSSSQFLSASDRDSDPKGTRPSSLPVPAKFETEYPDHLEIVDAYSHNELNDPLLRLPAEIASEIIRHASPIKTQYHYNGPTPEFFLATPVDVATRPLELSAVCKNWRNLAFSDPRLWTDIVMRRTGMAWTLSQELVEQWISRTGSLPLTLTLHWEPVAQNEDPLDVNLLKLMNHICSVAHRWRSVAFRMHSVFLRVFSWAFGDTDTVVDLDNFIFVTTEDDLLGPIVTLPLRKTVIQPKTAVMTVGLFIPPTSIQWTNVAEVTLFKVYPEAFLSILPNFTSLRKIWTSFVTNNFGPTFPVPTIIIELPHLTEFNTAGVKAQDLTRFFPYLRTPSLNSITVSRNRDDPIDSMPLASLHCMLMGAKALENLMLGDISILPEDLMALLETLPHLRRLSLKYAWAGAQVLPDSLLNRLSSTVALDGTDKFLPHLMRLSYSGPRTFSWDAVANFLESHDRCERHLHPSRQAESLRPLIYFRLTVFPAYLPNDVIDRDVLTRLMALPGKCVHTDIDIDLINVSLRHWGIDSSGIAFQFPTVAQFA